MLIAETANAVEDLVLYGAMYSLMHDAGASKSLQWSAEFKFRNGEAWHGFGATCEQAVASAVDRVRAARRRYECRSIATVALEDR